MAMHNYMTDREHNQAALDISARMVFDRASNILRDGNPVHDECKALQVLSYTAIFSGYSNTTINTFYDLVNEENEKNDDQDGWTK